MAVPGAGAACFRCRSELAADGTRTVGRAAVCESCGAPVRVCRNCAFYAPGAYNDCREPSAERVVEKERANFCDFFQLGSAAAGAAKSGPARAALDALFRKS
jgi:hypothetical protein